MTAKTRTSPFQAALLALTIGLLGCTYSQAQVAQSELEQRDGLWYLKGSDEPYSGWVDGDNGPSGQIVEGKRDGDWVWTYDGGGKEFVMVYDEGDRVKGTGWHPNGHIESEMSFKDGKPDGSRRSWDTDGNLRHERFYVDGVLEGRETVLDHNGAVLYTANYKNGELDGEVVWWYADGSPRWTTHYEAGVKTGTWSQMAPDGGLIMETIWEDGELVSRHNPHAGH